MKRIVYALLTLSFGLLTFKANAQAIDMNVTGANILPNPALYPGTVTGSFNVTAEILDETLSSDDLSGGFATITIALSGLQGSSAILPTGAGADLFNWVYEPATNSYTGFSRDVTMTADVVYPITLAGLPTTGVVTTNTVGFQINLTPPTDLFASETNDDAVQIFTHTDLNLPVTLVSFSAKKEGSTVTLAWATTEETNSDYFEIQRSLNGKTWNRLGTVKSQGESSVLVNYSFSDNTPGGGENLYRLKMVDNDKTFAYSAVRNVVFEDQSDFKPYPNPVSDKFLIQNYQQIKQVVLYNVGGVKMYGSQKVTSEGIDVSRLLPGTYTAVLTLNDGTIRTHKVAVVR